jgi:hypothetical protein
VPVVFLIAIVVVLVAIFLAATGRGGEMAYEHADHAPLDLGPVSSADVALLRPPTALWGYNMQVTDAALDQIAQAMRDRDVTISYLQEQLAGYERNGTYTEPRGGHARPDQETPEATGSDGGPELQDTAEFKDTDDAFGILPVSPATEEPAEAPEFPEPPRTTLRLRASGRKPPAEPEPQDPTQPSKALPPEDEEPHDPTHPSAIMAPDALSPDEGPGPQVAFDTHGWWAEQKEAAREEQAKRRSGPGQDDDLAAVEEQGW